MYYIKDITPVEEYQGIYYKREDLAYYTGPDRPSGAKVRQYRAMLAKSPPGTPCLVGCSAPSAMQVYVADAAKVAGVPGIVYVPGRKDWHPSTKWAAANGAEIREVRPGYLSTVRAQARNRAMELGNVVRWDPALAIHDVARQVGNIPEGVKRIVVPCGSGLTVAGILVGLLTFRPIPICVVRVSPMADLMTITAKAKKVADDLKLQMRCTMEQEDYPGPYDRPLYAYLPQPPDIQPDLARMPLDPYYAAKAVPYLVPGDCLWIPGRRPMAAC